jgi:hypothetical protein
MKDLQGPPRGNSPALPESTRLERYRTRWVLKKTPAQEPVARTIAALFFDELNPRWRV